MAVGLPTGATADADPVAPKAVESRRLVDGQLIEGPGAAVPGPGNIRGRVINSDPRLVLFENFVSEEEVEHLLGLCEGRWAQSMVSRGKASELHGVTSTDKAGSYGEEAIGQSRTSNSVRLTFDESYVVERIAARVASVCGLGLEYVESLVVLRYEPGQFFKMHHDGAMRPSTVFVYLNGVGLEDGGQTYFPHLGYKIRPEACTALMWSNRTPDGAADQRMQHEALPVLRGVKYAMNCFVNIHPQRDTSNIVLVPVAPPAESEGGTAEVNYAANADSPEGCAAAADVAERRAEEAGRQGDIPDPPSM